MGLSVKVKMKGVDLRAYRALGNDFKDSVEGAMDETGSYLVERIILNTPIDTGDLRASIKYSVDKLSLEIGSDLPYALKMHESVWQAGPLSAQQPSQPEGGVGNKYITRVVDFWKPYIRKHLGSRAIELFKIKIMKKYKRSLG